MKTGLGMVVLFLFLSQIALGYLISQSAETRRTIGEQEQTIMQQVQAIESLQNRVAGFERDLAGEKAARLAAEEQVTALQNGQNVCSSSNIQQQTAASTPQPLQPLQKVNQLWPFTRLDGRLALAFINLLILAGSGLAIIRKGTNPLHDLWHLRVSLRDKKSPIALASANLSTIVWVRMTRQQCQE